MPRFVSKTAFLEMLGDQNLAAVLTAAKASVLVEAWVTKFESQKDPPGIDLDYESTRAGVEALERAGLLTAGTVARMYPAESAPARVRVLSPFDSVWPEQYDATRAGDLWTLTDSGAQFAAEYIEEV